MSAWSDLQGLSDMWGGVKGSFGGVGGAAGTAPVKTSEQQNQAQNQSVAGSYFANPEIANSLLGNTGNLVNQASSQYNDIVNNPTGSQAFQNSLVGMLAALNPSEQASRRSLADTFRAAGNTASSTYAKAAAGNESNIMRNRGELASNLLAKLYPAVTQAAFAPIGQADSLLNAQKMQAQQATGSSSGSATGWSFPPQQATGGGGGGGGSTGGLYSGAGTAYGQNPGSSGFYGVRQSPSQYIGGGPSATYNAPAGSDSSVNNYSGGGAGDTFTTGDQGWGSFSQDPAGNANWW